MPKKPTQSEALFQAKQIVYSSNSRAWFVSSLDRSSHNMRLLLTVDTEYMQKFQAVIMCPFQKLGYPIDLWKNQ